MTTKRTNNRETIPPAARSAAVKAIEAGQSPTLVAQKMGVSTETLRNWRKQYGAAPRVTSAQRATVETLSTDELSADNRALRELVGTLVLNAWKAGHMSGSDIIQQIQAMQPQTSQAPYVPEPMTHPTANGSAAHLPQ